jgi:two-component sensor histidine kinase
MWCILSAFFTYFIFNAWLGTFVLLLNLAGLTIFLLNGSSNDVLNKGISIEEVDVRMVVNVFYVALALAFVIYKILDNNKQINARYEQQINKNEVLIKEIHHRVKNNLQIISSLLRLQSAESKSEVVHEHFDEAIGRIKSMALIHEKMYQKDDLSRIDLEGYFVSLADEIVGSIQSDTNIEVIVNSELADIDVESIVPISLIFNELITNSVKHGFKDKGSGTIRITVQVKDEEVKMSYADDGVWLKPSNESSFGLELLSTFTEQLDGKHSRDTSDGTQYEFIFPLNKITRK